MRIPTPTIALVTPLLLALLTAPLHAAETWPVRTGGSTTLYEVATDELHRLRADQPIALPQPADGAALRELARAGEAGDEVELVLYPVGQPRNKWTRRVLTRKVRVHLVPGTDANALAKSVGARSEGELSYAPGHHIFRTGATGVALEAAQRLRGRPGVLEAEALLAKLRQRKAVPNDPLFNIQWHLLNTGQLGGTPGVHLNVTNVWDNYRGAGITINVVDDGLEAAHPDLASSVNTVLGYDYRDNDADPKPEGAAGQNATGEPNADSHGTAVGGVIAARGGNNIGVAGVAYEATLEGVRLVGGNPSDDTDAAAVLHSNAVVHVSNNSWGPPDGQNEKGGVGPLTLAALQTASTQGRGGKGTIVVWAGGNGAAAGDNANYDGFNSSIYTVSVGALNDLGKKADYSERGACLLVSAPSGGDTQGGPGARDQATATTDVQGDRGYNRSDKNIGDAPDELADRDYTQNFNGTSSATPMVSGVVALMLQANPNLGWRDVQEILVRTATKNDAVNNEWLTNSAGLRFNPNFGAGLVNAAAAVQTALAWNNLPAQQNSALEQTGFALAVPDNDATGLTRSFDFASSNLRVEHAVVTVTIDHSRRGDLTVTLVSPAGTVSPLAELHPDTNANYTAHQFLSTFHWGEDSRGTWQVKVADRRADETGTLQSVKVQLYGGQPPIATLAAIGAQGGHFQFSVNGAAGIGYTVQATTNLSPANWIDLGTVPGLGATESLLHTNALSGQRLFYRIAR